MTAHADDTTGAAPSATGAAIAERGGGVGGLCECWSPVRWGARTGSVGPWSYAGLTDGARRWLLAKADPYHQHANQMMAWGGVRKTSGEGKVEFQPWQLPTPDEALAWAEANDRLDASRRHAGAMAFLASFAPKAEAVAGGVQ